MVGAQLGKTSTPDGGRQCTEDGGLQCTDITPTNYVVFSKPSVFLGSILIGLKESESC